MVQQSRDAQKVEAFLGLLKIWRDNGGEESAYYPFESLAAFSPLLRDKAGVERMLTLVQENTAGAISFKIREEHRSLSDRAGQSGVYKGLSGPHPVGIDIHVSDPKLLEKYAARVIAKVSGKKFDAKIIQSIEIIKRDEDGKVFVIVNEQHVDEPIKVNSRGKYWGNLIEVAEHGIAYSDDPTDVINYFNTNKNCPLYKATPWSLSEILVADGDRLYASPSVSIKIKASKTLAQRRKKAT